MNKAQITALAKDLAKAEYALVTHGMMGTPADVEDRFEARANYTVLRDMVSEKQRDYDAAFRKWKEEGYPE